MESALSTWLQLREPADTAARSLRLTREVADRLAGLDPVHVLDLGTGTGSNLRYLASCLPPRQRWLLVDRDATLLERVPIVTAPWAAARGYDMQADANEHVIRGRGLECHAETRQHDLGALDDEGIFDRRHLVTASALLDLTSESWLRALASRCQTAHATVLFTMTYDGSSSCDPPEPEDERVRDLLNRHQRTDKGLGGSAAGPEAAELVVRVFEDAGYSVRRERSDWSLAPSDAGLQRQLVDGWAEAAAEIAPGDAAAIADWRLRRRTHVDQGRSRIIVGHVDVAGWFDGAHSARGQA